MTFKSRGGFAAARIADLSRHRAERVGRHSDRVSACAGRDGVLVRYNQRAVELWGRAPRLGDPAELKRGAFRRYGPDGSPLPFSSSPVATVLRTGETLLGAELTIERPDGSRVPVLMNVAPLKGASGSIEGAVCSFQEFTERKRAEEELRNLSEQLGAEVERRTLERDRIWNVSEDLLAVGNFDGYFISINPAWTRLLGWSERRNQVHACERTAPSRRCRRTRSRTRSGSRVACRPCAWKIASATRTAVGGGCNGR